MSSTAILHTNHGDITVELFDDVFAEAAATTAVVTATVRSTAVRLTRRRRCRDGEPPCGWRMWCLLRCDA